MSSTNVIDGVSGNNYIAEFWASKLSYLLNTHSYSCDELGNLINASVSPSTLFDLCVTAGDVGRALVKLKLGKSDCDFLSSDHLRYASAVIATPLAAYFTSILRHGYMPNVLRDCVVIPIPLRILVVVLIIVGLL